MSREPLRLCRRYHVVWVDVLWQARGRCPAQFVVLGVECVTQLGARFQHRAVRVEVRHEPRPHHRAVLVGDVGVAQDVVRIHHMRPPRSAKARHGRREQEEPHSVDDVEVAYRRQHRERRVVDHHAAVGVLFALVVAIRPERAHEVSPVQSVSVGHEVSHHVVDFGWRVAVVGRFLRLELLDKRAVFLALVGEAHLDAIEHAPSFRSHSSCSIFRSSLSTLRTLMRYQLASDERDQPHLRR